MDVGWVGCGAGAESLEGLEEFRSDDGMFWEGVGTDEDDENG